MAKKQPLGPNDFHDAISFRERLFDAGRWIRTADELLVAASLLEPEIEAQWAVVRVEDGRVVECSPRTPIQGPYFMLVAFAIENLLKAVRVQREHAGLRNRLLEKVPQCIQTHDLLKLFREVGLSVDVAEEELVMRLVRSAVWAGRYPVPTDPRALHALTQSTSGQLYLAPYFGRDDVARASALIARVRLFAVESTKTASN